MRALKPGACRLGGLVKGGVRDALNGAWERRRKLRQRPPFSAAFPQTDSYCWLIYVIILHNIFELRAISRVLGYLLPLPSSIFAAPAHTSPQPLPSCPGWSRGYRDC